jgi:hypothetical protein
MRRLLLPLVLTTLACSSDPEAPVAEVDSGVADSSTTPTDSGTPVDSSVEEGGLELDSAIDSGVDSATPPDTTPPGDTFVPPMDTGPGDVGKARIHEVYVDRNLEGDKVEFVEIAAPVGTPLENLWLRHIDDKGAAIFELRVADAGMKMKASGFWVVGTSFVTAVDKTHPLTAWGLTNAGGSIQLLRKDIAMTVVDVVGYGTAPATAAMDPKKTIEGTAAALPASGSTGKTIGRKAVPGDTDNNSTDFCTMAATPGAANGACL